MENLKTEFWDRIEEVRSGMLGIKGEGRLVAMSPQIDDDLPGQIWFITAKGTDLAKGVSGGARDAQLVISDDAQGLYADIDGTLTHSTSREALDEVWSFVADSWFEGSKTDPDVCLLQFTPKQAAVSITPASGVTFLYEMAKAQITGDKPAMGAQGVITF